MFRLPIKSPLRPFLTLPFGDTKYIDWYKANGVNIDAHNGADFVCGSSLQTYGTELVCPFPTAKVVKISFESPMSTKGNGVVIEAKNDLDVYQVVFWHTGEVKLYLGDSVKEGDVVCYIGNSGLCSPAPTTEFPYNGSHLHLMVKKNNVLIDPLTIFDASSWYLGIDSGSQHDISPLLWRWNLKGIKDWWLKMIDAYKFWK